MTATDLKARIEAIHRIESAKLIAGLVRTVRDVGLAEDLAQDALVAALEDWPRSGVPEKPGAWLRTTAKRRGVDLLRRKKRLREKFREIQGELERQPDLSGAALSALDEPVRDDMLRLIFLTCHPALSIEARVALTLRLLAGLTTDEIARAFLVPEATIAQRVVRAKRTLHRHRAAFEELAGADVAERLEAVMEVLYLLFNEGYSATSGDDWLRPALCEDAMRLGRVLAGLVPDRAEVHGLVALMEIQASRARARTAPDGTPILLLEQDRRRWDALLIRRGLAALERAENLGGTPGPYVLQASIAACHARARVAADTDWARIAGLYAALAEVTPSPVVELNRAVAVAFAEGPAAGLVLVDALAGDPALREYHLLPSVRADFLIKLGRPSEARRELERAAALTRNARERALLLERAASCKEAS